jgi:lipid II:glycine glycyltransferase (peptidoglycan interpeptide bridge formation enzyme)
VHVIELKNGFSVEIDRIGKEDWNSIIQQFEDASLYQTWSYGSVRWGEKNISHVVLRKNGEVKAASQARILKFPVIKGGIAYIPWGPFWRIKKEEADYDNLVQIVRALKDEYVNRRKLFLRILPNEIERQNEEMRKIFTAEGFSRKQSAYRTMLLDLSLDKEDLLKNMNKQCRSRINKALRTEFDVKEGTNDELYQELLIPYFEMVSRKKFTPGVDINEFREIQKDLPEPLKMKIFVCGYKDKPVSSILGSAMGNKGIFILGGTNEAGLKQKASYLTPWLLIEWMKDENLRWCDLGGYNPDTNPGTARFKKGFNGLDVRHVGEFNACSSVKNSIIVNLGEKIKSITKKKI